MCSYPVVRPSQCCSGPYPNYSYQCVFLPPVRCTTTNPDVVRMTKATINRTRFSLTSVVMRRLDLVLVNLPVSVEATSPFGTHSEVSLSRQAPLTTKAIVTALLSVWFSFSTTLLTILPPANGRMTCQTILQAAQLTLQVDLPTTIGARLNILCTIVVTHGTTTTVRTMFVVRTLTLNVGLENSVLITGTPDTTPLIGLRKQMVNSGVKTNRFYTLQMTSGTVVSSLTVTFSGCPSQLGVSLARNRVTLKSIGMVTSSVTNEAINALQTGISVLQTLPGVLYLPAYRKVRLNPRTSGQEETTREITTLFNTNSITSVVSPISMSKTTLFPPFGGPKVGPAVVTSHLLAKCAHKATPQRWTWCKILHLVRSPTSIVVHCHRSQHRLLMQCEFA